MKNIFLILLTTLTLFSCNKENNREEMTTSKNEKLLIETSIIPLASITNYIGWQEVEANSIVPAWVSVHGFEMKPENMIKIQKSDLVIYLNLDHIDSFLNKAINDKKNIVVWSDINLITQNKKDHSNEEEIQEEHEENEENHEEDKNQIDPHVWNSWENAIKIATKIAWELSILRPEQKTYFENNLLSFKNELNLEKDNFIKETKEKNMKDFIIFHDAYNYLFTELNLDISKKHVFQKNVLSDPNSIEMKDLLDDIKTKNIKFAFKEPQFQNTNLDKLTKENNINMYILNPLWTDISKNWYISNYKTNLENLKNIYE